MNQTTDACRGTRPARARTGHRRRGAAAVVTAVLAGTLAVAGCSASSGNDSSAGSAKRAAAPAQAGSGAPDRSASRADASGSTAGGTAPAGGRTTAAPDTYLVRTADLTVRTPHVQDALTRARDLAAAAGGYSGDEDTTVDPRGRTQSSVQLRVPPAGYDKLLGDLSALGTLLERKVSVSDVTGQVVDVTSRIRSQQASVARVRALMDRAGSLTDVVTLESELSTREAALESLEAQQASLRSRVDLATVTLRLVEPAARPAPPAPARHDSFWTTVGHALGNGWHAFYVTVRGLLIALSVLLPFLVVAALLALAYRVVRRRLPRRDAPSSLRAPDGTPRRAPAAVAPYPTAPPAPGAPDDEEPPEA
ncbi:DUF4349 domain-containing protein [Actinacidiphila acididurans]|uniref:DUF4349 domain-containing protein n=1 Tax=Actinacidiphila acididurans TaxID=2784346 RepID=A0ABS2TZH8_9ACTN|nr:DUF4349 domain-containing protein [Actinacidiphila acididurans]MBM9507368.1 DUF4349 domain-containing protein [Actinacidiphila acididurans]